MLKSLVFSAKHQVLSGETLFHQIGALFRRIEPHVSLDRTFSKTQRFYANEAPCIYLCKNRSRSDASDWVLDQSSLYICFRLLPSTQRAVFKAKFDIALSGNLVLNSALKSVRLVSSSTEEDFFNGEL